MLGTCRCPDIPLAQIEWRPAFVWRHRAKRAAAWTELSHNPCFHLQVPRRCGRAQGAGAGETDKRHKAVPAVLAGGQQLHQALQCDEGIVRLPLLLRRVCRQVRRRLL